MRSKDPAKKVVRDIRRKTRRKHSTEDKIRIVLEALRGEESIAALFRRQDGLCQQQQDAETEHKCTRETLFHDNRGTIAKRGNAMGHGDQRSKQLSAKIS